MSLQALHASFTALPLGQIKPVGWLYDQLRIQADGFTGHLEEHWPDVGPDNGWLGGSGESWERGPYYLDGLLPLAYLLEDSRLIDKARRWIEWSLASQRENGMFGPHQIVTVNGEVNKSYDWWHYMIMLKVFTQYEEATGDVRVVPFLGKFFRYVHSIIRQQPLQGWAQMRGAEMMLSIFWLYRRTQDSELLDLAQIIDRQSFDWSSLMNEFPFWRKVDDFDLRAHVVNLAMAAKVPAMRYELNGDRKEEQAIRNGIDKLMTYHGQAHGMFSGDELLSGTHPSQGVELCAVVEYMFSMEHLVRVFGDGQYGDILEKVAFNALPAAITADWTAHQYDQQVNQVQCNIAERNWFNRDDANLFGLEPNFGCCTANMHQGWPKLAAHLWMADEPGGGLAAVSYAPCDVHARVGSGTRAVIRVRGDYPFRDQVRIRLDLSQPERFPLSLRIPAWCAAPSLSVNGEKIALTAEKGFARITREWYNGDELMLSLPMETRLMQRHMYAASVEKGPLVYALPIGENWQMIQAREKFHDWEAYPATPWRYGLLSGAGFETLESDMPRQPFHAASSPIRLRTKGQLVRNWRMAGNSADSPPLNPDVTGQPVHDLELVPYGGAKLRIGEFPLIRNPE